MVALGKAYIEVRADLAAFPADLRAKLEAAFREVGATARFDGLDEAAERGGKEAADHLAEEFDKETDKNMNDSGKKAGRSFFSGLKGIFPALAAAFLPVVIALAIEIASYLLPAVTALAAALPAALSTGIAGMVALKLATHGVGDAIKAAFSGDPAKLQTALAGLAPSARDFVMEISKARPALHDLQQFVQQVFFNQLEGDITMLVRTLLPTMRAGLVGVAVDIGKIGDQVLRAFVTHRADIQSIFLGAHAALAPLIPAFGNFVKMFLTLAAVGGPFVAALSQGFAKMLTNFSNFIQYQASTGGLASFFSTALVILQQVGGLLHNALYLVTSITNALAATGGQGLGMLGELLGMLGDFFSSPAGKGALVAVFHLMNVVLAALGKILAPLLPAIGLLASTLGDQLSRSVVALTPFLVELAQAAAQVLIAFTPLLVVVGQLIVALAPILTFLASNPKLVADAVLAWFAYRTAIQAATLAQLWFDAAADANPLGALVLAIEAIIAVIVLLVLNWQTVSRWGVAAWDAIKAAGVAVWHWMEGAGKAIAGFFADIGRWFERLPGMILGFLLGLPLMVVHVFEDMVQGVAYAIGFGIGLWLALMIKVPMLLWQALVALPDLIVGVFNTVSIWVVNSMTSLGLWLGEFFSALPGRIWGFVSSIPGLLRDAFVTAFHWAQKAVEDGGQRILDFARGLPGRLAGFFSNVGHDILSGLKDGINGVIRSFNSGIDKAGGFLHIGLPHIPQLARGEIVDSPTLAMIGEAGREVVIPTTDPVRARQLADQSGLTQLLSVGAPAVNVNVTAILGTGEILRVMDQRVELKMGQEAAALAGGQRTGGF